MREKQKDPISHFQHGRIQHSNAYNLISTEYQGEKIFDWTNELFVLPIDLNCKHQ